MKWGLQKQNHLCSWEPSSLLPTSPHLHFPSRRNQVQTSFRRTPCLGVAGAPRAGTCIHTFQLSVSSSCSASGYPHPVPPECLPICLERLSPPNLEGWGRGQSAPEKTPSGPSFIQHWPSISLGPPSRYITHSWNSWDHLERGEV